MTSVEGVGVIEIRDAQLSDAGAYTCEAINNQNSVFGNPDIIVTVVATPGKSLPTCLHLYPLYYS